MPSIPPCSIRVSLLFGGWLVVGRLLAQDGDGWHEIPHEHGSFESRKLCRSYVAHTMKKSLDHAYAVEDSRKCVEESEPAKRSK